MTGFIREKYYRLSYTDLVVLEIGEKYRLALQICAKEQLARTSDRPAPALNQAGLDGCLAGHPKKTYQQCLMPKVGSKQNIERDNEAKLPIPSYKACIQK